MNSRLTVIGAAFFAAGVFGQVTTAPSHYGSFTGFGNINYPGVGHAPTMIYPNIFNSSFPSRLGGTVRGYSRSPVAGSARGVAHPGGHSRQVIVPVPIVVGGGYYPYDAPPAGYAPLGQTSMGFTPMGYAPAGYADPGAVPMPQQQPVTPPVVIINQSYRPEQVSPVVRDYSEADLPPAGSGGLRSYDAPVRPMPEPSEARPARKTVSEEKPTIYLIAFRDHTILPALAYWVEGDTLNYITEQGTPNRASLSLIDKAFSRQLNGERSVEFSLPD